MTGRFVVFLASRTLRGRSGTARYLRGSVLGIALSLVPLIVVMEVSTGMIDGITARLLEVERPARERDEGRVGRGARHPQLERRRWRVKGQVDQA